MHAAPVENEKIDSNVESGFLCPKPALENCYCSEPAVSQWFKDAQGCWFCKCTGTSTPSNYKKVQQMRDDCVRMEAANKVRGGARYRFRPLRAGEEVDTKYTAWVRSRMCGDGTQPCLRLRDCKTGQPCSVVSQIWISVVKILMCIIINYDLMI